LPASLIPVVPSLVAMRCRVATTFWGGNSPTWKQALVAFFPETLLTTAIDDVTLNLVWKRLHGRLSRADVRHGSGKPSVQGAAREPNKLRWSFDL